MQGSTGRRAGRRLAQTMGMALGVWLTAAVAGAQPLEQPEGEVRTCEAFANRLYRRERPALLPLTVEWERELRVDPFDGSVGRQKVATVLHGLATFAGEGGRTEGRFLCLLAGPSRALFFHLLPLSLSSGAQADPLRACVASAEGAANVEACLAQRLTQAEQSLETAIATARKGLQDLEQGSGRTGLASAFDAAQASWRAYRDATCRLEGLEADPPSAAATFEQACRARMALERAHGFGQR
jgi:uncharacterized protein YecT (DUF1311 family)